MQLQLTEPGLLYRYDPTRPDPIVRWKVNLPENPAYVIGFNIDRMGQKPWWRIAGRTTRYETAQEALTVLQKEHDASLSG